MRTYGEWKKVGRGPKECGDGAEAMWAIEVARVIVCYKGLYWGAGKQGRGKQYDNGKSGRGKVENKKCRSKVGWEEGLDNKYKLPKQPPNQKVPRKKEGVVKAGGRRTAKEWENGESSRSQFDCLSFLERGGRWRK